MNWTRLCDILGHGIIAVIGGLVVIAFAVALVTCCYIAVKKTRYDFERDYVLEAPAMAAEEALSNILPGKHVAYEIGGVFKHDLYIALETKGDVVTYRSVDGRTVSFKSDKWETIEVPLNGGTYVAD